MRKDLRSLRHILEQLAEEESTRLYRQAHRMERHGCSRESVEACREEARQLHMTGYPERLVTYEAHDRFRYAFKIQ